MDTLIREKNGKEEIWYSEDYLKLQIENAFRAGLSNGMRVEFHAITPMDGECVEDLSKIFWQKIHEEYQKRYQEGLVIRGGGFNERKEFKNYATSLYLKKT